jgi:hypothetical protein
MLRRLRSRLVRRRRAARRDGWTLYRQFADLVATASHPAPAPDPVRVGFAVFGAGVPHLIVDHLLAAALEQRGAVTQFLLCDLPSLPACDERIAQVQPNERCASCLAQKRPFLDVSGVDWVPMSRYLGDDAAAAEAEARAVVAALRDDELTGFTADGWPVGAWLGSSVAGYLRADSHGMAPEVVAARRSFLVVGILALRSAIAWLDEFRPDVLVVLSGRHVFWRAAREVAQARGIKVVSREMYDESFDRHVYAVNSSCEDPALDAGWAEARHRPLTPDQEARVDHFLRGLPAFARQTAADPVLETDATAIRQTLGLTGTRPLLVLFTNVSWDLFVAERDHAFDGQMEWLAATFAFVRDHPELDLVIRAHPAEIVPKFRTVGRIVEQITERFSPLPENVYLVGPESDLSSDTLRAMATCNLVYCASVGLEAAVAGQPVLVCGAPYYARKGFTVDVDSPAEYRSLLERIAADDTPSAPPDSPTLARRFVHLMKFRYAMDMHWTTADPMRLELTISDLGDLAPGRSTVVDTVCDGILHRVEILLPG